VWGYAVERRAVAGAAFLLLGAPIGASLARFAGRARGAVWGALALGPFGAGLLASSMVLQIRIQMLAAEGISGDRWRDPMKAVIDQSAWLIGLGTTASVLVCLAIAATWVRAHESKSLAAIDGVTRSRNRA
jgi:hypothetical protein